MYAITENNILSQQDIHVSNNEVEYIFNVLNLYYYF